METFLLNRAHGSVDPRLFAKAQTTRLLHHLSPAPKIQFSARRPGPREDADSHEIAGDPLVAHWTYVNRLSIGPQDEGRFMISGGADSTIHLWDLQTRGSEMNHRHIPLASVSRFTHCQAHKHAITSMSIFPEQNLETMFSTAHDHAFKVYRFLPTEIKPLLTFHLESTAISHSYSSHPASSPLVAIGGMEKDVRLLDLRSGLSTHSLRGHSGSVRSVQWAPHIPHVLASGSRDGTAIIFDIRRGGYNSALGYLDMNRHVGPTVGSYYPRDADDSDWDLLPGTPRGIAHEWGVTGIRWTSDGSHLVTAGSESQIRVWNAETGENTLVNFGPHIRNNAEWNIGERAPILIPKEMTTSGHETLIWPQATATDERGEMFMFEVHDGSFIKKLKVPGLVRGQGTMRDLRTAARINDVAWRGNGASGQGLELFTAHGDGSIRSWVSNEPGEGPTEEEELANLDRKRKRDVLDDIYRGFF